MAINPNADFNDLSTWLNENLLITNSFVPHIDEIPNVKSKGIYFWFMHPNGYKTLSNYVTINPINPKYTKDIDGIKYDLVYLGTAGTGKKGNSNLNERFEWHVNQNHSESNICHGTLSTLRAGLGALLADDLIIPNTEEAVNTFMKDYMKVFWIEYSDNKSLIDNDEKILIKGIKPLLNLKNNPNSKAIAQANTSQVYKTRRAEIYKNTRLRLGCKGEHSKKINKTPTKDSPSLELHLKKNNFDMEIEKINLSKKFKVVMVCAGDKNNSFFTSYPDDNFVNEPNQPNEHHPDETMENKKLRLQES